MTRIFSITNNKGGTGKTTTTLNLGAAFAKRGYKVLLIDLDSQCNLSIATNADTSGNHIGKLLLGECSFEQAVNHAGLIDVLPSSDNLLSYEYSINNEAGGEYLLKEVLESKKYDYILIDTPPSLGSLTINALVASNFYIVPMQGENFAYVGLDRILQIAGKVKKRMNSNLELAGVLLLKFDVRTKFGQVVYEKLSNDSKINLFKTFIRQDISLMEATAFQQNIFEYAPDSRGASDFSNLANEILIQNEQKTI